MTKSISIDLSLFEPDFTVGRRWFVLRTKSRQEKVVSALLAEQGVRYLLLLTPVSRYRGKRKFSIDQPLFAGYVFVRGVPEDVYELDRLGRIAGLVQVADQSGLNLELKSLSIACANRCDLDPYPHLAVGRQVEITSGPLRGVCGSVESRGNDRTCLVLSVNILGQSVSMPLDASLVDVC